MIKNKNKNLEWALPLLRHGCDGNLIPQECDGFQNTAEFIHVERDVYTLQRPTFLCGNHISLLLFPSPSFPKA